MAATARRGASRAVAPRPEYPARFLVGRSLGRGPGRQLGRHTTVLAMAVASCLALTGYVCAVASGHRAPPGNNGAVSGITSLVRSPAFAAALANASRVASTRTALTPRDRRYCLPAAAACVDLTGRVSWPQDDGAAGYGPVLPSPASGVKGPRG